MNHRDDEILYLLKNSELKSQAFRQLVEKYKEPIYKLIRRMVISHDDANDLTQEVFIKIWKHLDKFRGDSKLSTWIYRIAVNATLTFLKSKRQHISFEKLFIENQSKTQSAVSLHYLQPDDILVKLHRCVTKLPVKQQLVFQLRYFEEMSYEQIAEITNTSVGSLKASFHHAVKKIEELMFIPD